MTMAQPFENQAFRDTDTEVAKGGDANLKALSAECTMCEPDNSQAAEDMKLSNYTDYRPAEDFGPIEIDGVEGSG